MEYQIKDGVVLDSKTQQRIGTVNAHLLQLDPDISTAEWNSVTTYLREHPLQNGKLSRKKTGFHHTYEIFEGVPYRVDHSLTSVGRYEERGYLGEGGLGNVKTICSQSGTERVIKIEGLSEAEYTAYQSIGSSNEAECGNYHGLTFREYLRKTRTKKAWREDKPSIYGKKILIQEKLPGVCGIDFLRQHKEPGSLTEAQRLQVAILVLLACGGLVYSGWLHRDLKWDNINIDFEKLKLGICDLGSMISYQDQKQELTRQERVGTVGYAAPEAMYPVSGFFRYSEKSELFSCGRILRLLFKPTSGEREYINKNMILGSEPVNSAEIGVQSYWQDWEQAASQRHQRTTFKSALQFFVERLKAINLVAAQTLEQKSQREVGEEQAKTLMDWAELLHFTNYEKGIELCKRVMTLEVSAETKVQAFQKGIDFYFRWANFIMFEPKYGQAIGVLKQGFLFAASQAPTESEKFKETARCNAAGKALRLKYLLHCEQRLSAKSSLEEQQKLIETLLEARKLTGSDLHKSELGLKALKLMTVEKKDLVLMAQLSKEFEGFGDNFHADRDYLASIYCYNQILFHNLCTPEEFNKIELKRIKSDLENCPIKAVVADDLYRCTTLLQFQFQKTFHNDMPVNTTEVAVCCRKQFSKLAL